MTKNQQFSYRAIISAKIVASLQTAALQKSGIKLFALSSQQLTGNAWACSCTWGAEVRVKSIYCPLTMGLNGGNMCIKDMQKRSCLLL